MFSSNSSQVSDDKLFVEEVFQTWLYQGNGSTQTITNGIDLAGKGGLVWLKYRDVAATHQLYDTARGASLFLGSNTTNAQATASGVTQFNSTGFNLGSATGANQNNGTYASWTFRKAPKFFDVVTYTGNGSSSQVQNHSLGSTPGMIIVKQTSTSGENWVVWHRSLASSNLLYLNTTDAAFVDNGSRIKAADATTFTVGLNGSTGANGATYVAYLFAHDTTSDGIIQCGSYTGNGSATGPTVTLGWEPQWLLVKDATSAWDWRVVDNMRGMPVGSGAASLFPNLSNAEFTTSTVAFSPTATGFQVAGSAAQINTNGNTYIYIAIRRGPMRTPTTGTSVFSPQLSVSTGGQSITTNFPIDLQIGGWRNGLAANFAFSDRLRGISSNSTEIARFVTANTTNAEATTGFTTLSWNNIGYGQDNYLASSGTGVYWNFRRAPSFFDEVCYTGTGVARTVSHNLGVVPELMIVKARSVAGYGWFVYAAPQGATKYGRLDLTNAFATASTIWNDTAPTASVFSLGAAAGVNDVYTYVAYLFASCPGVSKVGSYTGNGSSQTINCGFSGGARFVLIKRTDSTGDWYVWDTARGIVAGNDPHLSLNTTAAEVTSNDTIDTDSSGFVVNQVSATNVNVNAATYIFMAVA